MKIFIFKPSQCWSYCGGGLVILAESFEQCQSMFDEKLHWREEEAEKEEYSFNNWTFVESFVIDSFDEDKPRIVLSDYNWG